MSLLLPEQAYMDKQAFDRESWTLDTWQDQKLGHILFHMVKAEGKIAERKEFPGQLRPTSNMKFIAADLAIYRSQLANLFSLDEEAVTRGRGVVNVNSLRVVQDELSVACGSLAQYLEPLQHAPVSEDGQVLRAAQGLHLAATGIAGMLDLDLVELHQQKMAENIANAETQS